MARKRQASRHHWRNLALFTLVLALAGALIVSVGLAWQSAYGHTHPQRWPIAGSPADHGLAYETVTFDSADGTPLKGWLVWAVEDRGYQATIILCHGFTGTRTEMLPEAHLLARHGYNALLFDFRGHGESGGDLVTLGYLETLDVQGAVAYLRARPDTAGHRIGVLGHSMGAATVIRAAARTPEILAVVAEGAYASLPETIANDFSNLTRLPQFPFASLVVAIGEWQTGMDTAAVQPIDDIAQLSPRPVLIIHGLSDSVIPPQNGLQLYQAAREPKELWQPEGVAHVQASRQLPQAFAARVISFFDQALLTE